MNLIGLSGYARSGKDTVGAYLVKHGYLSRPVVRHAFADPMRDIVRWFRGDIGSLRETNPEGYRADMQFLGEYLRSRVFPDVWVAGAQRRYELARCSSKNPIVVFTDVRYPNEMQWIRSHGGQIWWIHKADCGTVNEHESERHYDYIREGADRTISNDGTIEELEEVVVRFGDGWFTGGNVQDPLSGPGGSGDGR